MKQLKPYLLGLVLAANAVGQTIILDNSDPKAARLVGKWTESTNHPTVHGANYVHDDAARCGTKYVEFSTPISTAGDYRVSAWWAAHENRPTNVPISVFHAAGSDTVIVNQRTNGSQWNLIGTYPFTTNAAAVVRVSNATNTAGYVIADAVRLDYVGASAPFSKAYWSSLAFNWQLVQQPPNIGSVGTRIYWTTNRPADFSPASVSDYKATNCASWPILVSLPPGVTSYQVTNREALLSDREHFFVATHVVTTNTALESGPSDLVYIAPRIEVLPVHQFKAVVTLELTFDPRP